MLIQDKIVYEGKLVELMIRNYSLADFEGLLEIQRQAFPPPFPEELLWNKKQIEEHVTRFPEGAICVQVDDQIVASMTSLIISYKKGELHTWSQVTDDGYIRNHQPNGNTLYVVDICVHPSYRSLGLGKRMLYAMYDLVVGLGLERLLGGGRMPNYHQWQGQLTPEEYVDKVVQGEIKDPVISFMLKCDRIPYGVVHHYLEDEESCDCAALMAWENPGMLLKKNK